MVAKKRRKKHDTQTNTHTHTSLNAAYYNITCLNINLKERTNPKQKIVQKSKKRQHNKNTREIIRRSATVLTKTLRSRRRSRTKKKKSI